ncbi:MAG: tRNA (adenosine(37)-N6)-threonylcarbamoyltransferase complex dimerization subunit type 1 TsaB [Calditrichota bacterium]
MTSKLKPQPLLAIETATSVCSCAVIIEPQIVFERSVTTNRKHGELLPDLVQSVCREAGIKLDSIGYIAVSIGPGSFTGLRVGLSLAKGIAAYSGAFLRPVGTLEGLAYRMAEALESSAEFTACPMTIARRGEAFGKLFKISGLNIKPQGEIFLLCNLESVNEDFAQVYIGGEGAEILLESKRVSESASERVGESARGRAGETGFKYLPGIRAGASAIGQIGWLARASGAAHYRSDYPLTPNYAAEFTIRAKAG